MYKGPLMSRVMEVTATTQTLSGLYNKAVETHLSANRQYTKGIYLTFTYDKRPFHTKQSTNIKKQPKLSITQRLPTDFLKDGLLMYM